MLALIVAMSGALMSCPFLVPEALLGLLPPRANTSHKGDFGNVAVLGGAPGMLGAALLAARAALLLGAGRVWCAPLDVRMNVDPVQPELMFATPQQALALPAPGCLVVGPGLGQDAAARQWLHAAMAAPSTLLLDADALNLLAADASLRDALTRRTAATLYTPHPGEAARLLGWTHAPRTEAEREAALTALGARYPGVIVLKGHATCIRAEDGACWRNPSGNPGLAAPGMGDVLAGMIAALIAQGMAPAPAACLGVWLHGAAGDALRQALGGPIGLCASEVARTARRLLNLQMNLQTRTAHTPSAPPDAL